MSDVFSPYQIDFSVKNTSKTFGFSKKKVTFKFGVANGEALGAGQTGANCRGSEHEVIFTWSLNSGKRQILADGKDVHFSETGQNGWTGDQVFQHHFQIRVPGLIAPLRAHLITQPKVADDPRVRPFDLRVNGLSYFQMCKIFQLGTPQMISRPVTKGSSRGGGGGDGGGRSSYREENDAYLSPEERKAIAAAKLASLRDLKAPGGGGGSMGGGPPPAPPPAVEENLINFLDDPTPAPQPGQFGQPAYSSVSLDSSFGGPPPQAPAPAASYAQQPYSNYSLGVPAAALPAAPSQPNGFGMQPGPYGSQSSMYASQSSMGSSGQFGAGGGLPPQPPAPAQPPAPYGAQPYYHQQPPPVAPTSSFGAAPPAQALASPSNASYQSYGSAPTFAQPPPPQQQQQQQMPPQQMPPQQQQQQQYQQQQQPQYGAPQGYPQPPPQGYPQYY